MVAALQGDSAPGGFLFVLSPNPEMLFVCVLTEYREQKQTPSLSVSLSICLSLYVSVSVSLSVSLCVSVSLFLSVCPSLSVSLSVSFSLSVCLSLSRSPALGRRAERTRWIVFEKQEQRQTFRPINSLGIRTAVSSV